MTHRSRYRSYFQNLYVRRIVLIIQFPISLFLMILLYGIAELSQNMSEYWSAWQPEKL